MICYIIILSALVLILYIIVNYNYLVEHFNSEQDNRNLMNFGKEDCIFRHASDPGKFKCDANYYLSGYQTVNQATKMICCKPPPPPFIKSFSASATADAS